MKQQGTSRSRAPRAPRAIKALAVAAALACSAAAQAGTATATVTSFSYTVSGGTLSWLDPYQSFEANALAGGGLIDGASDSFDTDDWFPAIAGASVTGAFAGASTQGGQTFFASATTSTTLGPPNTPRNQANAFALQSGTFTLSQAGSVTFNIGYQLNAASAGGNAVSDFSIATVHFNAADTDGSSGGDSSVTLRSFDALSNVASRSGSFQFTVALAANEQGFYTLDGSAVSFSSVTAVPEPATWASMAGGLLGIAGLARRRLRGTQTA